MPQFYAFVQAAYATIAAWVAANEFAALVIFTIAALAVETYLARRMPGIGMGDQNQGQFVVTRGTVEVDQILYGESRKGGVLMFLDVSGPQNDYLYQVIHVFGHECDSILSVFFDDREIFPSDIDPSGNVIHGYYAGRVTIKKYTGTSTQLADPMLVGTFSADGRWTATDRSRGNTYIVVRMLRDDPTNDSQVKVFATGAPGAITSVVKGMKVYDPRSDSTVGGSGTQRNSDRTTWVWNDNSALCCANYLTLGNSVTADTNLGFAEPWSTINISELVAAANRCDAIVTFTVGGVNVSLRQYTCNGIIDTSATLADTKDALEASMFGKVFWSGGQWHFFAGGYDVPTLTLSEKDFGGDFSFMPLSQHTDRSNSVHAVYPDSEQSFKSNECQEMLNAQYALDDGEVIELTIKLPFTNLELSAQYISWQTMQQSRNMQHFNAVMKPSAIQVRAWDVVFFNVAMFGWINKPFRCISWKNGDLGLPQLQFKEEQQALWAWTSTLARTRQISASVPPTPETPPPCTGLVGTSIPGGVYLYWTNPSISSFEYIEVTQGGAVIDRVVANNYTYFTAAPGVVYAVRTVNRYGIRGIQIGVTVAAGAVAQDNGLLTLIGRGQVVTTASTMKKVGGGNGWDSDGYSLQMYSGGCALSFKPSQNNCYIMTGLNSDPAADSNYTSLDYSWYTQADGNCSIYEGGSGVQGVGAYTANTIFSITYDGTAVRYFMDGNLIRGPLPIVGAKFALDSSFYSPGGQIEDISFTSLTAAPNSINFVARGQCQVSGNSIQKVGGVGAWDSDCYSSQSYANGVYVSWTAPDTASNYMVGLSSNPTANQSYETIDFAIYCNGGTAVIYESGGLGLNVGTYAAGSTFSVQYDGLWIRYYVNGILVRSVSSPNRTFSMDSSFITPGSIATAVSFGPQSVATPTAFIARGSAVAGADTFSKSLSGVSTWGDADVYSQNGYRTCHIVFKPNSASVGDWMMGLNTDPTLDMNYTSLDYAWHQSTGNANDLLIYVNGNYTGINLGPVVISDVLAITYDGTTVKFLRNNIVQYSVSDPGRTFFMDSSFYSPGCGVNSVIWGPTTNLAVLDPAQINDKAIQNKHVADGAIDPSTAQVTAKGSIPPSLVSIAFTYTSTTTSITISWGAMTIYRDDATTTAVSAGSLAITGLLAATTYKVYPYLDDSTNATVVTFVSGGAATGSPAAAYAASGNAVAASVMYFRGHVPLNAFSVTTPSSGTGGGGGGGVGCLHPRTRVVLANGKEVLAGELRPGDELAAPNSPGRIAFIVRRRCTRWLNVGLGHVESTVTFDHRFQFATGEEVRAEDLRIGNILAAEGDHLEVTRLELIHEDENMVSIELDQPHLYYLGRGGPLCHNPKP